jgi:hypothetical protein
MSGWHLETELIRCYVGGAVGPELAAPAEAHLMACAACRARLASHVDAGRMSAIWAEVVDRVDAPRPSLLERAIVRLGVSEATARPVAATPTLRGPWLAAITCVLAFAAVAAQSDERWLRTFLVEADGRRDGGALDRAARRYNRGDWCDLVAGDYRVHWRTLPPRVGARASA